ncbi:MAG: 16S rRNA (guanine(527)-N(7))-methyltransferase RsmG [Spirochaetota bacterium]
MYEKKISSYLKKSSLQLTNEAIQHLSFFLKLLLQYNQSHDLTRIKDIDEIIIKHFVDSLYITSLIDIPSPLLDIGTGAGFPGIPLAIALRNNFFILAESRHKRVEFLTIVKNELHLDNVEIYPHLVTEKSFFNVNGVITRAVESIDETLHRCRHFLIKNNFIIFMKGPAVDEEKIEEHHDYSLVIKKHYTLPDTQYQRRIVVYKKVTDEIKKIYYIAKDSTSPDGIAVTSSENKRFKEFKKIAANPKKYNTTFVSGKKIIKELMDTKPQLCKYLIIYDQYTESDRDFIHLISNFDKQRIIILKKSLFSEIDITEAQQPVMVVQVPALTQWDFTCRELSLMLPFQDPVNMGAAIRSAVAFGVTHIIVCENAAYPFHQKAVRASAGAVFHCSIEKGPALHMLDTRTIPCPILALDMEGKNIYDYKFPPKAILLAGTEGPGLPAIDTAVKLRIPIHTVESLNATVAVSIALYEWHKQNKNIQY